ncbi:MAG: thiamine pyrophosphate-dependent enzyme [Patescibacteria group bacterium]|jgi:pyruvate ferredoxin oxidoreductase beta subunit
MQKSIAVKPKSKQLLSPGHRACAGCTQLIAARTVAEALGPNTIIANATGCLEVTTTPYPESAWGMPWIHSLFENASSVASGVQAALIHKAKMKQTGLPLPKVVAQGGDGGTFDIGFGNISGMWERGEDILYICYDNEAYANTGVQASGATPPGANTTTSPAGIASVGSELRKKDMVAVALAHGLRYVAQTTAGFPIDIAAKVKKAVATPGPSYIQIMVPCIPGWGIEPADGIKLGKLGAQTGLYPVIEYVNGQLSGSMKVSKPAPRVEEYLKMQRRFSHLFKSEAGKKQIEFLQLVADENIRKYQL